MSLIVKVMSDESIPDEDSRKVHRVYSDVERVHFVRQANGVTSAILTTKNDEILEVVLNGNCYIMNENGKTISSFCPSKYAKI